MHAYILESYGTFGSQEFAIWSDWMIVWFQLKGYDEQNPVTLQVFIGSDTGKVKPHGFYQACKVCGKNATTCTEREIEGTTVIELQLLPSEDMTAR